MYAPTYGYGPTPNSSSPFNPNGGPPQPHNPHQHQHQHQQQGQQPQPMMYNPQAYGAAHQSPYGASGMGGNAGGMPMMQNSGLAHMPGGVAQYQTPYTSSPYGASIPSSSASLPPNFLPTTSSSNAPSFAMNASTMNMNPQGMVNQRVMQPPSSTPTNRASPYGNTQHITPPNAQGAQSQFATPQNTINTSQQGQQAGTTITTPQTPNFPGGSQVVATPMSPGSEAREKERVTLLLEINVELLKTVLALQAAQQAEKKEENATTGAEAPVDKEKQEKKAASGREYVECMRRLQCNLAYLAAIADRSHKPSSQIPAHPAIMSAPPLTSKSKPSPSISTAAKADASNSSPSASDNVKKEEEEEKKDKDDTKAPVGNEEERIETLKEQYKKLQGLFPGVDPKKDPPIQRVNDAARQQMQAKAQAQAQMQAAAAGQKAAQGQAQGQAAR